jgi:hypothetical protein
LDSNIVVLRLRIAEAVRLLDVHLDFPLVAPGALCTFGSSILIRLFFDRRTLQGGRRHFAEDAAIGYGETPRLVELKASRNLGDARVCRIGCPQCRTRQVQPPQQEIPGRTDAQEFSAT